MVSTTWYEWNNKVAEVGSFRDPKASPLAAWADDIGPRFASQSRDPRWTGRRALDPDALPAERARLSSLAEFHPATELHAYLQDAGWAAQMVRVESDAVTTLSLPANRDDVPRAARAAYQRFWTSDRLRQFAEINADRRMPDNVRSSFVDAAARLRTADEIQVLHDRTFDAWWDTQWLDPDYAQQRISFVGGAGGNALTERLTGEPLWAGGATPRSEADYLRGRQVWRSMSQTKAPVELGQKVLDGTASLPADELQALVDLIAACPHMEIRRRFDERFNKPRT